MFDLIHHFLRRIITVYQIAEIQHFWIAPVAAETLHRLAAGQGKGCSVIVVTTEQPSGIMFISLSAATQNDSISEPGTWDRRTRDAAGPS
mgnify:CR=1 FL=1